MFVITAESEEKFQELIDKAVSKAMATSHRKRIKYLTVSDVSAMTKFGDDYIRDETKKGNLAGIFKGGQWRYTEDDVHEWMKPVIKKAR